MFGFRTIGGSKAATGGSGSGGIGEAPNDGKPYVRQNKAWNFLSLDGFTTDPADDDPALYFRQGDQWVAYTGGEGGGSGGLPEAPLDGKRYLRTATDDGQQGKWDALDLTPYLRVQDFAAQLLLASSAYELNIEQFYSAANNTDVLALRAAFAFITGNALNAAKIRFKPGGGLGSGGTYFYDALCEYVGNARLELDFDGAQVRAVGNLGCIRYTELPSNALNTGPNSFWVRRARVQANGTAVNLFHWNMLYSSSRLLTTGECIDCQFLPFKADDSATDAFDTCLRLTNTWFFRARYCDAFQKPKPSGSFLTGTSFMRLEGACIETERRHCQTSYFGSAVDIDYANMAAFDTAALPAGLYRGLRVSQANGATGYFAVKGGLGARAYGIYRTGTTLFTTGTTTWYNLDGTVGGTFSISATEDAGRPPEAYHDDNCTDINCDYVVDGLMPAGMHSGLTFIMVTVRDGQMAARLGNLRLSYAAGISIAQTVPALTASGVDYDFSNCTGIEITGNTFVNNGVAGQTGIRLRNCDGWTVTGNTFIGAINNLVAIDVDNTAKDGAFANNSPIGAVSITNTGNRYGDLSPKGNRFKSNGAMGVGIDLDDTNVTDYTPNVSATTGALSAYTVSAHYQFTNGILTINGTVSVTNRGTAQGQLKIDLPAIWAAHAQYLGPVTAINSTKGRVLYGIVDATSIYLNGPDATDVFRDASGTQGNYTYSFNASLICLAN